MYIYAESQVGEKLNRIINLILDHICITYKVSCNQIECCNYIAL